LLLFSFGEVELIIDVVEVLEAVAVVSLATSHLERPRIWIVERKKRETR